MKARPTLPCPAWNLSTSKAVTSASTGGYSRHILCRLPPLYRNHPALSWRRRMELPHTEQLDFLEILLQYHKSAKIFPHHPGRLCGMPVHILSQHAHIRKNKIRLRKAKAPVPVFPPLQRDLKLLRFRELPALNIIVECHPCCIGKHPVEIVF